MNKISLFFAAAGSALLLGACVEEGAVRPELPAAATASADDLLVVDCLLPGQVRKLGSQLTYLTARRPVQTTAQDCQIRGGEYVAYDRATYASALRIWMPLAQQGDPDAQNKLGEIYERGVGGAPDYIEAASWYRKAAEQGLERAQINLGFLYEKGLGVPRDPGSALTWYRKASKLPDAVMIDRTAYEAQRAQMAALREDLAESRSQLDQARRALREREAQLQQERERLRREIESSTGGSATPAERKRLEEARARLQRQGAMLAQSRKQIQSLEATSRRQQERVLLLESEGASLREHLALVRSELEHSREDLTHYQARAAEMKSQLERARAELGDLRSGNPQATQDRLEGLRAQLAAREAELREREQQVAQLEARTTDLGRELERARDADRDEREALASALAEARSRLQAARAAAGERASTVEDLNARLAAERAGRTDADARAEALARELREREEALARNQEIVARLEKESSQWQRKLQQLQAKSSDSQDEGAARSTVDGVPFAPPAIQLIEPPLVAVRSGVETRVPVKRGPGQRSLIGQVTAPAGLYALTLNGAPVEADPQGLFKTEVPLAGSETPVSLVAIDREGRRSTLAFSLVTESEDVEAVAIRANPLEGVDIGGYHALVIGNADYQHLPELDTSGNDAAAVAEVLEQNFGYEVTLLRDATRYEILSALNRLRKELTEKDNLLVYYAGHGELDRINLRGHWLPVDAELHSTANWISNVSITDILNAMSARQILLVADSCYSGTLTRSSLAQLESGKSMETRVHWLKTLARMRSRTALTSGGLAPVLDGGGGQHSVFAKAFLGVLRDMEDVTEGQRLYRDVSARVAYEANRYQVEQVPEYAPIKFSGHESGDYLFIPRQYLAQL